MKNIKQDGFYNFNRNQILEITNHLKKKFKNVKLSEHGAKSYSISIDTRTIIKFEWKDLGRGTRAVYGSIDNTVLSVEEYSKIKQILGEVGVTIDENAFTPILMVIGGLLLLAFIPVILGIISGSVLLGKIVAVILILISVTIIFYLKSKRYKKRGAIK